MKASQEVSKGVLAQHQARVVGMVVGGCGGWLRRVDSCTCVGAAAAVGVSSCVMRPCA